MTEPHEDHYSGTATLVAGERETVVAVRLRGGFQPIDGRHHWYGRLSPDAALDELGSGATVTLRTGSGEATGRISDRDPWGRYRVAGTGRPPY